MFCFSSFECTSVVVVGVVVIVVVVIVVVEVVVVVGVAVVLFSKLFIHICVITVVLFFCF